MKLLNRENKKTSQNNQIKAQRIFFILVYLSEKNQFSV